MKAEVVRQIVACPSPLLGRVIPKIAQKTNTHPDAVLALRSEWMDRLTGKCPACLGKYTSKCDGYCQTKLIDKRPPITLLKKLDPKEPLMHRQCKCGKIFNHTVGHVLAMFKKHGSFRPSNLCTRCRPHRRRNLRPRKSEKRSSSKG